MAQEKQTCRTCIFFVITTKHFREVNIDTVQLFRLREHFKYTSWLVSAYFIEEDGVKYGAFSGMRELILYKITMGNK